MVGTCIAAAWTDVCKAEMIRLRDDKGMLPGRRMCCMYYMQIQLLVVAVCSLWVKSSASLLKETDLCKTSKP